MGEQKPEGKMVSDVPQGMVSPLKCRNNKFAFACAMLASMTSILLGYDIGVMIGAASVHQGRSQDNRYPSGGIGIGYALMIAPVYTTEVSPASSHGFLTSFPEVFINTGILLGDVSNYAFARLPEHLGRRLMLGVGAIPSVFLTVGVLGMPESPRWLVMQGRLDEARRVLAKTSDTPEEAELQLSKIKTVVGILENCTNDIITVPKLSHGEGVWKESDYNICRF